MFVGKDFGYLFDTWIFLQDESILMGNCRFFSNLIFSFLYDREMKSSNLLFPIFPFTYLFGKLDIALVDFHLREDDKLLFSILSFHWEKVKGFYVVYEVKLHYSNGNSISGFQLDQLTRRFKFTSVCDFFFINCITLL